ncbi:DUF6716 putative glycosyltransferase [Tritonibacter sp. SIMBA_163]|uniref:DUF6716 putative glycosyltransferase n=2 Tax=Pseudomonadota TaxID=1224 RepID=UPI00397FFC62
MHRALFIASFDSQLKWCRTVRQEFEQRGFICRTIVPGVRSALSEAQIQAAGFDQVERRSWDDTVSLALSHDVVISSLSGPMTRKLNFELSVSTQPGPRPLLVAGWVGIIIEKLTAGYLDRHGCDVVAVNSKEDFARFSNVAHTLDIPTDNLILTGLPFLPNTIAAQKTGPIQRVLFADQPTVPENREERLFVYNSMIRYALRHPDREVILKPRHRPDEDTFHKMKFAPEALLKDREVPSNFRIDYTPISEMVHNIDLMVTMSSTASLEALAVGTRVAYPLDLGVHEKYGNHVFEKTGLLRSFEQIMADDIGTPAESFIDSYFFSKPAASFEMIVSRCEELLDRGEWPHDRAWNTDFFKSMRTAHFEIQELRQEYRHLRARGQEQNTSMLQRCLRRFGALLKAILPHRVSLQLWRIAKQYRLLP